MAPPEHLIPSSAALSEHSQLPPPAALSEHSQPPPPAASALPKGKGKKKDDDDLSEEDLALKEQLELYVVRAQDADSGLQKHALESMRQEILSATSSMSSVPKPLKFLHPHYGTLKSYFETMPESELKKYMADILSMLALTMSVKGERESLKFRLLGSEGDIGLWGLEYVRNLADEIAQEFQKRQDDDLNALMMLVQQIISFHTKVSGETAEEFKKRQVKEAYFEDNFEAALMFMTDIVEKEPESADLFSDRAQILIKLNRYEDAIADCIRALKVDRVFFKAQYRKGVSYMKLNMFDEAQVSLKKALFLRPDDVKARDLLRECEARITSELMIKHDIPPVADRDSIGPISKKGVSIGYDNADKSSEAMNVGPMKVFIIHDKKMLEHRPKGTDNEKPLRIVNVLKKLDDEHLLRRCEVSSQVDHVDMKYILAVHDGDYIEAVKALSPKGKQPKTYFSIDMVASKGTPEAVFLAAGAVIEACRRVVCGMDSAFAIVRPPGHHAKKAYGSGFCYLNNLAIAARYLQAEHNVGRVLIVDFDVHHGDGTEDIFYDDSTVMYCSIHRDLYFPHEGAQPRMRIGSGQGLGFTVNVRLNKPLTDGDMLAAMDHVFLPLASQFEPDFVLVSAGFDAAFGDMGDSLVTAPCYRELVWKLKSILNGRIVLALEGGYCLDSLPECCAQAVKALLDGRGTEFVQTNYEGADVVTWNEIRETYNELGTYWPVFAEGFQEPEVVPD